MNLARAPSSSPSEASNPAPSPEAGLPITVAASHLDGLVLALTPNTHSYNYRSAVLFGHAQPVTDPAEKLYAMELITNAVVPQRWDNSRIPPNAAEMQSTSILRVKITTGSAKIRSGGPHDEKADMDDEELKGRVWTGVVPVHITMGEPVGAEYNKVGKAPEYLEVWRKEMNIEGEAFAKAQASREMGAE